MKINFTPSGIYSTNIQKMNSKVPFGSVSVRAAGYSNECPDIFQATNDDCDIDIFQYADMPDNEKKFRNLPKEQKLDRELDFVNYIAGYGDEEDDYDFLERLTY